MKSPRVYICQDCPKTILHGRVYCADCWNIRRRHLARVLQIHKASPRPDSKTRAYLPWLRETFAISKAALEAAQKHHETLAIELQHLEIQQALLEARKEEEAKDLPWKFKAS